MTEIKRREVKKLNISVGLIRKLLHRNARASVAKIFAKAYPFDVARTLQS
jgi:hypothetical protein